MNVPIPWSPDIKLYGYRPSSFFDEIRKVWILLRLYSIGDDKSTFRQHLCEWASPYTSIRELPMEIPIVHGGLVVAAGYLWIEGLGDRGDCYQVVPDVFVSSAKFLGVNMPTVKAKLLTFRKPPTQVKVPFPIITGRDWYRRPVTHPSVFDLEWEKYHKAA